VTPKAIVTPPRRLDADARREQLIGVALTLTAAGGYAGLSLDEAAGRAGITRAALYRYFPRGKLDLFLAAIERAGEILTADLATDDSLPLEERRRRNFSMFIDHALAPSEAWRVHRHGRVSGLPEVDELDARFRDRIVAAMALNHFGTATPPPLGDLALRSYIAFAEVAFDDCRERGLDRDALFALLTRTLRSAVDAAQELDPRS
jgi:AcrR family transcriptional regulator